MPFLLKPEILGPLPPEGADVWWRADFITYSVSNEWGEHSHSYSKVKLTPYEVVRATPKGVFLASDFGGSEFVGGNWLKQLAVPTKELALQDLVARKDKHATMAQQRADAAKAQFDLAVRYLEQERTQK